MSKRKLLLADDSITIQKVVKLTFAGEGIEVVTASDGDAALEKFTEIQPDLVLADVNMPGLNGYQLCERIKSDDAARKTPVILLVGSFEPFDEVEAQRVGANDYLTKPFQSISQLVSKVSELLAADGGEETLNNETSSGAETENSLEEIDDSAESFDSSSSSAQSDDETIQTSQIGSLPTDEAQKFNASFVSEPLAEEDFEPLEKSFDAEFTDLRMFEVNENFAVEPQPVEQKDFSEIISTDAEIAPTDKKVYEFTDEPVSAAIESETQKFSANDLDEMNLLEIPRVESFADDRNFSPELIEAVARKVIERLSDQIVREIAAETVPQMAESIIKQMAEEKLKDKKTKEKAKK